MVFVVQEITYIGMIPIKKLLKLMNNDGNGHATYILMKMIFPPIHLSYLVCGGIYQQGETVSELVIFGAYLWYGIIS